MLYSVETFLPHLRGRRVRLWEDNQAVVAMLTSWTSRNPLLMGLIRRLWWLLDTHDISLHPVYIRSAANVWADALSRQVDPADWSLSSAAFHLLESRWGPHTVDCFASENTALLPRFFSAWASPTSSGVDAFAQPGWASENNLCVPPTECLDQLAHLLETNGAAATVVVPNWPAQSWYQLFQELSSERLVLPPGSAALGWELVAFRLERSLFLHGRVLETARAQDPTNPPAILLDAYSPRGVPVMCRVDESAPLSFVAAGATATTLLAPAAATSLSFPFLNALASLSPAYPHELPARDWAVLPSSVLLPTSGQVTALLPWSAAASPPLHAAVDALCLTSPSIRNMTSGTVSLFSGFSGRLRGPGQPPLLSEARHLVDALARVPFPQPVSVLLPPSLSSWRHGALVAPLPRLPAIVLRPLLSAATHRAGAWCTAVFSIWHTLLSVKVIVMQYLRFQYDSISSLLRAQSLHLRSLSKK